GRRQQYTKTVARGGQVLKLIAVYQDVGGQASSAKTKRLSWPLLASRTESNSRYAQCLTAHDQVLYIPLTTPGSMLLETYRKEEVILTCLLDPPQDRFRLLEIDVNSKFFVVRPTKRLSDERRLFQSDRVQAALRFCHENWDKWSRQLKVIHHIYPKKPRKISLGDKKTVKSASFRLVTFCLEHSKPNL
ncbi:hypothetical protein AAG570_007198, partial [Ranatra chinensis]